MILDPPGRERGPFPPRKEVYNPYVALITHIPHPFGTR